MQLETKVQIARATLSLLTLVASLFLLGVLVIVLCVGFDINPFRETTTSFLVAAFVGLIGVAIVLVLLNLATNVSLIADTKITELKVESRPGLMRKATIAFLSAAVAIVAVIFAGTYFSKERYLAVVRGQAEEVLRENGTLLDEVGRLLASGKAEDYKRVSEIRDFLENQRSELPELTVIYSGKFEGKLTLNAINRSIDYDEEKKTYRPTYYTCTANRDCEYLASFFSGRKGAIMQKYSVRGDDFFIYVPVEGKEALFVLLFERRNNYGKIGS